jgi:hypothetical protein
MTDRELLELAAKAAGLEGTWSTTIGGWSCLVQENGHPWQPLHDDGDALRLAVKRRIKLRYNAALGQALAWTEGDFMEFKVNVEDCGHDEAAATRRAIVRAAASSAQI